MTKEECIGLLKRYAEYNGMGIPNLVGCREAMRMAAELLERPSLPPDLDEAASAWTHNHPYSYPTEIFKGGVEYMAGQGVTVECGVRVYPTLDGESHPWVSLYKNGINVDSLKDIPGLESLGFEDGDKAIVQIRKK